MNNNLLKKIAKLESKVDHFETEFDYLNKILKECGFPEGIKTLKHTALELIVDSKISSEKF